MSGLSADLVLVPVDFSDESFAAVEKALEIVASPDRLHVIHVLPEINVAEPGVVWDTIDDESRRAHAEASLRERLTGPRYEGTTFHIAFGDPGLKITRAAEEIGADLIVIPSHGRTGLSHLLIGSVAERVVRHAACPVLVLKRPRG